MSTKAAETYDDEKDWIHCMICDGSYVEGGVTLVDKPLGVCIWCFSRGKLHHRYTLLYEALKQAVQSHEESCNCYSCAVYKVASDVMNATLQPTETTP